MTRRVVVHADGGSRGNPGPAAYGAVLADAETGAVIAEEGRRLGVATNNAAEYEGLIAGLRLARDHAPGASVEARLDSQLVVEQLSGRWRIKHADLAARAERARALAAEIGEVVYTWVPRAENADADRLVNRALDGEETAAAAGASLVDDVESGDAAERQAPARGWSASGGGATTLILLRHGVTVHTSAKRFSGGLGGDNPPLSDEGREQIAAAAAWLRGLGEDVAAVVSSPVRRTRESAQIVADELGLPVEEEPGFAEMEFGDWDGLTFLEVAERDQAGLDAWLGSLDVAPPGGESFRTVQERVHAGLERTLARHAGRTIVVVSHVTPIKTLVADALDAPLAAVFRMELTPASVSVIGYHPDHGGDGLRPSLRLYNALPPSRAALEPGSW
ncbi:bifunctional RNase H/acid phosphatase [Nocardioides sp. TRM66260-LWL]|uniref:bifunctional RNase H/acid phosphatase n=1 Tax=Nocardioides sp. TRM66260-LWL TaxID=2874478 RepID=UPI001CC76E5F|nr:bifunctional RNase H/acid phosphatase [Nocardioides sp. TRM66260-LWL]MBZ5736463.1 bifunctional RNase H/acid phosphatase [Nocardioides sp. TRM66260-LWL]